MVATGGRVRSAPRGSWRDKGVSQFRQLTMTVQLTSLLEIQNVFSSDGVENHLEDLIDNPSALDTIINQASERVFLYLRTKFAETDVAVNVWAREQATYIACYLISIRRGNPSLYTDMYAQALIDLEHVRDGMLNPGIPSKARAVVQTPMLDSRFYHVKRTNPTASTRVLPAQRVPRFPFQADQ